MNPVNYKTIIHVLLDLGFIDESVKGSHQAFRHVGSGTVILFSALFAEEELVRQEDLISVRRHLIENGLIAHDDLMRLIDADGELGATETSGLIAHSDEP